MMKKVEVFRNTKKRIILLTLAFLIIWEFVLLFAIYMTTYIRVSSDNQRSLYEFAQNYGVKEYDFVDPPQDDMDYRSIDGLEDSKIFYITKFDAEGNVLLLMNDVNPMMENSIFIEKCWNLAQSGKTQGTFDNLIYRIIRDDSGNIIVAMMDNTILNDSTKELLRNTIIVGFISLLFFGLIARYLAGKIVGPMEKSNEMQRQFLSDASHELKTPVAVIQANIDMLEREQGESKWSANIRYESKKMSELIIQMLESSQAEMMKYSIEKIDMSRLIVGEILPMETLAFEQGILIEDEIEDHILINADKTKMKQLASILIDNAISHTQKDPEGANSIHISLKKNRHNVLLNVSNPGEIGEKDRQHLFERFYRTDQSRSSNGHYGLGLYIAKTIMVGHRGDIEVKCENGMTSFICIFPLD